MRVVAELADLFAEVGRAEPVLVPLAAVLAAIAVLLAVLGWRRGRVPVFEIGVVYAGVVGLYAVYPLVGYVASGLRYGPLNDLRLLTGQPDPAAVGRIGWHYVVHLLSFVLAYLFFRGRLRLTRPQPEASSHATLVAAALCCVAVSAALMIPGLFFDLSARTYGESYSVYRKLPLIYAQIANRSGQMAFALQVVLLTALLSRFRRTKWLVLAWLAGSFLIMMIRLGSRSEFFMLLFAVLVLYHWQVRPLSLSLSAAGASMAVLVFLAVGSWRAGQTTAQDLPWSGGLFSQSSEFEVLFGNAYDLDQRKHDGGLAGLPPTLLAADLLGLVPQQLLPIEKVDPAEWYVNTFFPDYAATGGGLAFGTVSESIVGGGWLDLAARGVILGFLLAQLHRLVAQSLPSFWSLAFYAWLTSQVYQLFRNTTLSLLPTIVYGFMPAALLVIVLSSLVATLRDREGSSPEAAP